MPYLWDESFIRVVVTRAQPCIPTQASCSQNSMIDALSMGRGKEDRYRRTLSVVEELLVPLEVLKGRVPALHPCPPHTRHVTPRPSPILSCHTDCLTKQSVAEGLPSDHLEADEGLQHLRQAEAHEGRVVVLGVGTLPTASTRYGLDEFRVKPCSGVLPPSP